MKEEEQLEEWLGLLKQEKSGSKGQKGNLDIST
jgi:hypothetical protein